MDESPLYDAVNGGSSPDSSAAAPAPSAPDNTASSAPSAPQPSADGASGDSNSPNFDYNNVSFPSNGGSDLPRFKRTVGNTVKGVLMGLVMNGIPGAIAGGVSPQGVQHAADNQRQMADAKVKFASAQAANMVTEAAMRDQQLHNLPQEQQDAHNAASLEQMKELSGMGIQPTLVTDNNHGGSEAMAGLQQLTDSHGAVPPLFTINLGHKVLGYDLNQLIQAPMGLDQINKVRTVQGLPAVDPRIWQQMTATPQGRTQAIEQLNSALNFFNPAPSEENLSKYTNYVNTLKMQPESPDRDANLAKLQGVVGIMQKTLDATTKRATQQAASKAGAVASADELAKQNTPQGRATLAKTLAETTKARAEAAGAGTDKMWAEGKNPVTGESLNLSNAPDEMLIDSRTNQPVPFKMLSTLKPSQQETNRSDFAGSVLHSLDQIDQLRAAGKLPNGPLSGLTAKTLSSAGLGSEDAQKALNFISFAQSAATGAHVGGRFSSEIMDKMNHMIGINMNDSQFQGAADSIKDVMQQYVKQGGRQTVGQFKQGLVNSVVSVKGQRVKVTGFDKNGNIQGVPVQ